MIDIHSHILPGVDDGSKDIETSIEMIKKEIADGVETIILTPHVQSTVSRFEPSAHDLIFENLKQEVKKRDLKVNLYLGAEVFYRSFIKTDFSKVSLAGSKYILVEFSPRNDTPIEEIIYDLSRMGYIPIIAHVERYQYLELEDYIKIKASGALLQVNTTSVLGLDYKYIKKGVIHHLLKNKLIDFIATDSHNLTSRIPNMKEAYAYLKNQLDPVYLNQIFEANAKKILESIQ